MRLKTVGQWAIALGLAALTGGCSGPHSYTGAGCLIYLYSQPDMTGSALPIRADTDDLSKAWEQHAMSAKVVYGTWRLFSQSVFTGFMGDYKAPAEIPRLTPDHGLGSLECLEPAPEPKPPRYFLYWG
ncbi:MAG TPA: beta/gamma crystallin-related protein [Stellaceae bacterium]|nr:beta/gamma crystallin-related protein [Stellaceae bacterium]